MMKVVKEIAHQELILKPRYVANAWQPTLHALKQYSAFKALTSLMNLYKAKVPTPERECRLFNAS